MPTQKRFHNHSFFVMTVFVLFVLFSSLCSAIEDDSLVVIVLYDVSRSMEFAGEETKRFVRDEVVNSLEVSDFIAFVPFDLEPYPAPIPPVALDSATTRDWIKYQVDRLPDTTTRGTFYSTALRRADEIIRLRNQEKPGIPVVVIVTDEEGTWLRKDFAGKELDVSPLNPPQMYMDYFILAKLYRAPGNKKSGSTLTVANVPGTFGDKSDFVTDEKVGEIFSKIRARCQEVSKQKESNLVSAEGVENHPERGISPKFAVFVALLFLIGVFLVVRHRIRNARENITVILRSPVLPLRREVSDYTITLKPGEIITAGDDDNADLIIPGMKDSVEIENSKGKLVLTYPSRSTTLNPNEIEVLPGLDKEE